MQFGGQIISTETQLAALVQFISQQVRLGVAQLEIFSEKRQEVEIEHPVLAL